MSANSKQQTAPMLAHHTQDANTDDTVATRCASKIPAIFFFLAADQNADDNHDQDTIAHHRNLLYLKRKPRRCRAW
jgi:hypothetical protein